MKSAISTTIAAATRLAETEAEWYVDAYNQNFLAAGSLFSLDEEGEPMQTQAYVEVPGFDNITVFSPPESLGAVIYDLGQATSAMAVAAADLGIGTGHSSVGDQDAAREILGVPGDHDVTFLLGVGYPADRPLRPIVNPDRRPAGEVIHHGRW